MRHLFRSAAVIALAIASAAIVSPAAAQNAGVGAGGDFVRDTTLEADFNVIDLNIKSTVHLAKLVLVDMVQQGGGKVLFTSSIAATMRFPRFWKPRSFMTSARSWSLVRSRVSDLTQRTMARNSWVV